MPACFTEHLLGNCPQHQTAGALPAASSRSRADDVTRTVMGGADLA